jgi:hypothetical protein
MKRLALYCALGSLTASAALVAAQDTGLGFPEGYRSWYHHHSTVNLEGHSPEGNIGLQHVYANPLAVEGLKTGNFKDGAAFVVDRFSYAEGDNRTINQGSRKVVALMVRSAAKFGETGGWGFAAFKGGDPKAQVVKDGGKACFACHVPHADNNFLFTRGLN